MHRKALFASAVVGLAAASLVATPASAVTADSGSWVVAPTWWGWCPGSAVTQVVVQNWTTGTQTYSWTGADKVYIPVRRNMTNNLNVNVQCRRTTPMGMTGYALNVAGGGHTFYVGYPAGVYRA